MKILQINNYDYRKGGAESVFLNTIELLNQKGHHVIPFSSQKTKSSEVIDSDFLLKNSTNNKFGINLFRNFYSLEASQKIKTLIATFKPDIAHIHNIHGVITSSILPVLKKFDIPIVATIHGFKYLCPAYVFINGKGEICEACKGGKYYKCFTNNCSVEGRFKSFILSADSYFRDFLFPFDKYIDKFIFVSQFTQNKFVEFRPQLISKSHQIYNFYKSIPGKETRSSTDYYFYFGRLDREKGLFTLLEAFRKNPDKKLIMVGKGPLADKLNQLKSSNVEMLGYKRGNELEELIKNAYFIIVPSECYENNPMAIVESFAFGKPVIGSDLGGISELMDKNQNGFLFEPGNVVELADLITMTSKLNLSAYNDLSYNAKQFALRNFSPDNHYQKLLDIYSKLTR